MQNAHSAREVSEDEQDRWGDCALVLDFVVFRSGMALEQGAEMLQRDLEIVMTTVTQDGGALQQRISEALRGVYDMVRKPCLLKGDHAVVTKAMSQDGS